MKKLFLIISFLSFFIFKALSAEPEIILIADKDKIMLGEKIMLTLQIKDGGLENIIKGENYQVTAKPDNINIKYEIKPDKIGKLKLGPYSINYTGMIISSDVIEIEVTENIPADENKIIIEIPRGAKSHSVVVLRLTSKKFDLTDVLLKESELFNLAGTSCSSNVEIKEGGIMERNYSKNFEIIFYKKGRFTVNAAIFKNLPEFSIIDEAVIDIE